MTGRSSRFRAAPFSRSVRRLNVPSRVSVGVVGLVLIGGSGASRDFGPAKTSWRIEDPQAAKQKCLISSRFPSLTRVPLSASAAERRLLSAGAPEPPRRAADPGGECDLSEFAGDSLGTWLTYL